METIITVGYLSCSICHKVYKKPKYLPCYHSYCEECLVKLVVQSNITCPECRKTSTVPSGGVKQLPNNFFINRLLDEKALKRKVAGEEGVKCDVCVRGSTGEVLCLDCSAFLCSYCVDNHNHSKDCQNHSLMPLSELRSNKEKLAIAIKPKAKYAMCQKDELELKFYCETCDQLVCQYCITHHLGHDHDTVKEMAAKHRKELDKIMEPVEKMIKELSVAHKQISNTREKIIAEANDIDREIDRYYEELHQRLNQQRDELKKELHEAYEQKKNEIAPQLEQVGYIHAQLENIKDLNGVVMDGSDQEILFMKKQLADSVNRLTDHFNKSDTQPVQLTNMEFVPVEEYKNILPQFGHLFDGPCSNTSEALDIPHWVFEGENIEFKVITRDRNNRLCHKGGSKVVIQAQSSRGDVIPVEVKDNKDGSYSASFVANQVTEVKLSVTIKGQQIKGSPFGVKVRGQYTTIDKPSKIVSKVGKMEVPWGIAFGKNHIWAVTDRSNHCVRIFDRQGKMVQTFGSSGADKGKFNVPSGIAFDRNNHLFVTDSWNNRVQKFTATGTYLLQFGSRGSRNGQLNNPLGILVHNSEVFVAENNGKRISVFQLDGQFIRIIGSGYLKSPCYIAANANQLLVADCDQHCIAIFNTMDGNFVRKFGTRGTGSGQLRNPAGIATDMYGFILVTEEHNNRVSVFDKDGQFIRSFGSKGSGHGQFLLPRAIAVSPTGDIYICDSSNARIQIF